MNKGKGSRLRGTWLLFLYLYFRLPAFVPRGVSNKAKSGNWNKFRKIYVSNSTRGAKKLTQRDIVCSSAARSGFKCQDGLSQKFLRGARRRRPSAFQHIAGTAQVLPPLTPRLRRQLTAVRGRPACAPELAPQLGLEVGKHCADSAWRSFWRGARSRCQGRCLCVSTGGQAARLVPKTKKAAGCVEPQRYAQ